MRHSLVIGLLVFAVMVSALGVINAKHESRSLYNQLQVLRVDHDQLQTEWSQLQLEDSAWASRGRIQYLASDRLSMHEPRKYSIVVVRACSQSLRACEAAPQGADQGARSEVWWTK